MLDEAYIKGSKEELLKKLYGTAQPGSQVHEQMKVAIQVRCVEDIEKSVNTLRQSMENISSSSTKLGLKVFWLNIILAAATVSGVIIALLEFLDKSPK